MESSVLFVRTGSTHIGQFLGFGYVHHKVVVVRVFAYNLSGIHLFLREDEELSAVLQFVYGISKAVPDSIAMIEPLVRRSISPL